MEPVVPLAGAEHAACRRVAKQGLARSTRKDREEGRVIDDGWQGRARSSSTVGEFGILSYETGDRFVVGAVAEDANDECCELLGDGYEGADSGEVELATGLGARTGMIDRNL